MSVYLLVSDIHANYPAFSAVLDDSPSYDSLICLGDILGVCGYPHETVAEIQSMDTKSVLCGNHDISLIEHEQGLITNRALSRFEYQLTDTELTHKQTQWLEKKQAYSYVDDENMLLSHAYPTKEHAAGISPGNPGLKKRDYIQAASFIPNDREFTFVGHTHQQALLDCRAFEHDITIANPGSVGMPVQSDAKYATVDTELDPGERVTLHSTEYDSSTTIRTLQEKDCPVEWWK